VRRCRTAALGGHVDACDQCGHVRIRHYCVPALTSR
jgi:ribosomal protein L32